MRFLLNKHLLFGFLVAVFTLVLGLPAAAVAGKGGCKGKNCDPDPPPPPSGESCASSPSAFPAFAYAKQKSSRKGVSGYEIYLSNADGDCSILVHSISNYTDGKFNLEYTQNGNDGVIVWTQRYNENAGRKDATKDNDFVKMIRVQTANKEVTSPLPATSTTVADSGSSRLGYYYIDLSRNGESILLSHNYRDASDNNFYRISEIDIYSCSSNCSVSLPIYQHQDFLFNGLSYSPSGDRIYFNSENSTDGTYVAFIEKQNNSWSAPRLVTSEYNGNYPSTVRYFRRVDVAYTTNNSEILAFDFDNGDGTFATQIIDVTNCAGSNSLDCVSTGEANILDFVYDARTPRFNSDYFATSLFADTSTGDIVEYDMASFIKHMLTSGFVADSGSN